MKKSLLLQILVALLAAPAFGQSGGVASAWVGGAEGDPTASHGALGLGVRIPLWNRIGAMAELTYLTRSPGACEQSWPGSYRCALNGPLLFGGPRFAIVETDRIGAGISAGAGFFRHGDETFRTTEFAGAAGVESGLRLRDSLWLEARYRYFAVADENVEELLGERPTFSAILIGLGLGF